MTNRAGEEISAEDVENLAYRLPQVTHPAAVAMADPDLGEQVCLYAVLAPGTSLTLDQVRASMEAEGGARSVWPERLEIAGELLVMKVGRIDKKALRDELGRRVSP